MTRIPVFVVGGYLGAGKTTFINECLNRGLRNAAIIVNDFGEINIDASIISARHGDTLELSNGCVCCSIGTSLADTLFTILDRPTPPDMIIIEASGVADPASVAAYTHLQGLVLAGIIVMVDAMNALETARNPLLVAAFERQVRAAHLVALSKTDIAAPTMTSESRDLVTSLNPGAAIVAVDALALADLVVDHPASGHDSTVPPRTDGSAVSAFTSRVHRFATPPSLDVLREFLESLPQNAVRAKGAVETSDGTVVLVHKSGRHITTTPTSLAPTGLVIISTG